MKPTWIDKHEIILTDFSSLIVIKWSATKPDDPDAFEVTLTSDWVAWQGTDKEENRHEEVTTPYGMSADELESVAKALLEIVKRYKRV